MTKNIKIDEVLFDRIDKLQLMPRLAKFRKDYFNTHPSIGTELNLIIKDAWQESEGEPTEIRFAKAFNKTMEQIPVKINDWELTVGSETRYLRGAYMPINFNASEAQALLDEGKPTMGDSVTRGEISDKDWKVLQECTNFFKGKSAADLMKKTRAVTGNWYEDIVELHGVLPEESVTAFETLPDYEKILSNGIQAILKEAEEGIQKFAELQEKDLEKLRFWQSSVIVCKGVIRFANRYAHLARELSLKEQDPQRRSELKEIAEMCKRVPEKPARTFYEAAQSLQLLWIAQRLENLQEGMVTARLDQYLYPYFKRDLAEHRLTLEEAAEIICNLIVCLTREEKISFTHFRQHDQSTSVTNITLAGVTKAGEDAYNELSHLILHMMGLLKLAEPHISFAWYKGLSQRALMKAIETNVRLKGGNPQFINGEHLVDYFVGRGIPVEEARDWGVSGCTGCFPVSIGSDVKFAAGHINMPLVLDITLHNGIASITGKKVGIETGRLVEFKNFSDICKAFKKQYEFHVRKLIKYHHINFLAEVERCRMPFISSLLPLCMKNGGDFLSGGLGRYPLWAVKDRCIVDTSDSLMAIKKLVFDDKKLTLSELMGALDSNFAGNRGEEIRQLCLVAPKYGNDIDEVDKMVHDLGRFSASIINSENHPYGEPYSITRNGVSWHYYGGKGVGALPNGRKAGEPLNDGSLSAMRGCDTHGPTALLNSALKAGFGGKDQSTISVLNLRFPSSLFQGPETAKKLGMLTDTFMRNGGTHIQFNLLDQQDLIEAKKNPEQYKDLVVRVGGYSAYFVQLTPEVQDDIIRRTEHCL